MREASEFDRSSTEASEGTIFLRAVAGELGGLADQLEALQEELSNAITALPPAAREASSSQLQAIDYACQHARALGDVFAKLTPGALEDAALETALAQVPLADLAQRLRGKAIEASATFELF